MNDHLLLTILIFLPLAGSICLLPLWHSERWVKPVALLGRGAGACADLPAPSSLTP